MNKKTLCFFLGLLIIAGVLFVLSSQKGAEVSEEKSDVVILIEEGPPSSTLKDSSPSPATTSEAKGPDPEVIEYAEEVQKTLAGLVKTEDLQDLSEEEVHHTPLVVKKSGEKIGAMLETAEASPKLRPEAMKLLKSCAESTEAAPSIRALCWNKLVNKIPKWKIFVPLMDADVPQDIKDLASRL